MYVHLQLYLRVLEAMLGTETQRLPREHWKWLLSEMFHKALLACSLEIIIFSYALSDMEAPWYFSISPFIDMLHSNGVITSVFGSERVINATIEY